MTVRPTDYGDVWADLLDDWTAMTASTPPAGLVDQLAAMTSEGRLLELGVGTGYLAIPLADRGVRVEGLDASPAMLERLAAKAPGIGRHLADAADFDLGAPFDVIVFASSSISCLPDHAAMTTCFAAAARHLEPRGRFVVESTLHDDAWYHADGQLHFVQARGNGWKMHWFATNMPERRVVEVRRVLVRDGQVDLTLPHTECQVAPAELDAMADAAGLRLMERWGGWDGRPLTDEIKAVSVYAPAR